MSEELERALRRLPLRQPSALFEARMAALWVQPVQRRRPWGWAAAALFLAIVGSAGWLTLARPHGVAPDQPTTVTLPAPAVVADSQRPGDALAQVLLEGRARGLTVRQTTRQWADTGHELDTPVGPLRAFRAQSVEDVLWIDPETGASATVQQPREAIVWLWQAVY